LGWSQVCNSIVCIWSFQMFSAIEESISLSTPLFWDWKYTSYLLMTIFDPSASSKTYLMRSILSHHWEMRFEYWRNCLLGWSREWNWGWPIPCHQLVGLIFLTIITRLAHCYCFWFWHFCKGCHVSLKCILPFPWASSNCRHMQRFPSYLVLLLI